LWLITPKYRHTDRTPYPVEDLGRDITIPLPPGEKTGRLYRSRLQPNLEVIFVGCDDLYNRDGLYGNEFGDYEDNAERYIFFSRAVLEVMRSLELTPDLIHCHDWPSGLVPVFVKTMSPSSSALADTATIFTFHNLGSQGIFWHYDFAMTGLDWSWFTPDRLEFHGQFSMTKGGLVAADLITTVSQRYAEEVLHPEYGFGLEGLLWARRQDIHAVLNGVDYSVWDPAVDPDIAANYGPQDLSAKQRCRSHLHRLYGLAEGPEPIVAVVSRLLDRKGFDLISSGLDELLALPLKLVIMGRGEEKYHVFLSKAAQRYQGRAGVRVEYDKALAHQIMAGADIFLMPSRYEPCGLEQLYGLKYGAVPVVRATGGLDDTVVDVRRHPDRGTGYKFDDYSTQAMIGTLSDAVDHFHQPDFWRSLMLRGMRQDFSWAKAAAEYERLYAQAREKVERDR
jgi:starch synthase